MLITEVHLFGHGMGSDPEMMEAITGQTPVRVVRDAQGLNMALYRQTLDQVTDRSIAEGVPSPRTILEGAWADYDGEFAAHVAKHAMGELVRGTAYQFKDPKSALRMAGTFDLEDLGWTTWQEVGVALPRGGGAKTLSLFLSPEQEVGPKADGQTYEPFLISKAVMLEKARAVYAESKKDQ